MLVLQNNQLDDVLGSHSVPDMPLGDELEDIHVGGSFSELELFGLRVPLDILVKLARDQKH